MAVDSLLHVLGTVQLVVSASDLIFVAETTKSPFVNHFNGADAGKMVYYWMRWVNTRGEVGPWSAMVSATIGG